MSTRNPTSAYLGRIYLLRKIMGIFAFPIYSETQDITLGRKKLTHTLSIYKMHII